MSDTPIDVRASDLLHRAGFSVGDFAAIGIDGQRHWTVTASGPLGEIRVEGTTKADAWRLAVARVRDLFTLD